MRFQNKKKFNKYKNKRLKDKMSNISRKFFKIRLRKLIKIPT
jgi:hypothetical protein